MPRKHLHYAVDLDGTLAVYDHWRGHNRIGEPIPRMVDRIKKLLAEGHYVTIFTARLSGFDFIQGQRAAGNATHVVDAYDRLMRTVELIEEWCRMHIGQALPITAEKKPYFHAILDDRAEQILPNDGRNAALAFHELAKDCINIMIDQGMDPIILQQRFHELNRKFMQGKETL